MRLLLLKNNNDRNVLNLVNSFIFLNKSNNVSYNHPLTNLYYTTNIGNNIFPGHYTSIFNVELTEIYPSIGRPGPWILNLDLGEILNLTESGNLLQNDGYLSEDAGFFFPASLFETERKRVLMQRSCSRVTGWDGLNPPIVNDYSNRSPEVPRTAISSASSLIEEPLIVNQNPWTFTQTADDYTNYKLLNSKIIMPTKDNIEVLRRFRTRPNLKLQLRRILHKDTTWAYTSNWRKQKLYHNSIYGKKFHKFITPGVTKSYTPFIDLNRFSPKELQIPLLSIEPMNLPQPFYQASVRWKPGGSTWWRGYRSILGQQLSWATNAPKGQVVQRVITRWVARCWRVLSFACLRFWASTVASILERAGWSNTPIWVINQRAIENRLWQVYPGDVIQIRGLSGARRLLSIAPISRIEPSRRALWVRWAPALEIDELTQSVIVLHWGRPANVRTSTFPYLTHRLYNWKYRT